MADTPHYETIIVALDGTRETEGIIGHAIDLARRYSAPLVLVRSGDMRVLPPDDTGAIGPGAAIAAAPAVDRTSGIVIPTVGGAPEAGYVPPRAVDDSDAAGYLNVLDHELEASGLQVDHVDSAEDPVDAIVAEAQRRPHPLVVIGHRHRTAWERLFQGSTAERVLRDCPAPVLVVPLD